MNIKELEKELANYKDEPIVGQWQDYADKDETCTKWTEWVGGTEVTDNYVDRDTADSILTDYLHQGYDDVYIEEVSKESDLKEVKND